MRIVLQTGGAATVKRQSIFEILQAPNSGASPVGSTFYKTLFTCPREFALKYIAKMEPEKLSLALTIGWLFHYLLEAYYKSVQSWQSQFATDDTSDAMLFGGHIPAMREAYEALKPLADAEGYEEIYETAHRMITGYFEQYHLVNKWRIIAVEETLIYQEAFGYSARLDMLVEDLDRGGLYVVEHKTTKVIGADLLDSYELDIQILGQSWLLRKCVDLKKYPPFKGIIINIVSKHKTPQFVQHVVNPSQYHLAAFTKAVGNWHKLKVVYSDLGWPQALGHCSGHARGYSKCQFYEICHAHPEKSVADWVEAAELPHGFKRSTNLGEVQL